VYLDTLGSNGMTGWIQPEGRRGHFDKIEEADRLTTIKAARKAVGRASEPRVASILILPELALDITALEAVKDELREHEGARPCLTVVGLRHLPVDDGDTSRAGWVNEAVVLGPNGAELWRHRKLTYEGSDKPMGKYPPFVEDVRPGRT